MSSSSKARARRRASQTYFFKYQLARNPLKAEEEDLKQALIASLQSCGDELPSTKHRPPKQQQQHQQQHQQQQQQPQPQPQPQKQPQPQQQHQQQTKSLPPAQQVHSPQTPHDDQEEPDEEEHLERHRPETEDFLTFICFRVTNNVSNEIELSCGPTASASIRRSTSPYKPNSTSRRRPTRQSPRLASSSKKISQIDTLNHYTAYEEDIKRAQLALDDMAQEINHEPTPNKTSQANGKLGQQMPPLKNNKHLVKGLMTREFAGAFADEEIIFESIKNHKL